MTDGSSSSGGEAGSGSESGTTPVITFTGYATDNDVNGPGQALSPTLGWEQLAGDLIVVLINYDPSVSLTQISDSAGNVYTQFGSPTADDDYHETMYYCLSAKAAGVNANTITVNFSADTRVASSSVAVFGFTVPGYTWIQDQYINSSQIDVIAVTSGSVTTRYANEVLVSGTGVRTEVTLASGGSWVAEPKDAYGDVQEYQIVTSTQATIAATFTQSLSAPAVSQLGTFAVTPRDGG
jgi:hypothetical protein